LPTFAGTIAGRRGFEVHVHAFDKAFFVHLITAFAVMPAWKRRNDFL
jgi:hypothetical protein